MPRVPDDLPAWTSVAPWAAVLSASYALYRHEAALEHLAWHLGYGGAAGLLVAAGWRLVTGRLPGAGHLWFLGGYLYMAVPDVLWLLPVLFGGQPYPHAPWMDVFLGHYSLDLWPLATPFLVPTVLVAVLAYQLADEQRRQRALTLLSP